LQADIIVFNPFKAEFFYGIPINKTSYDIKVTNYFHNLEVKIIIIKSINCTDIKYFQVLTSSTKKI
jgi:pyridoxal/pyridoxine/pyridoxamine kinase